MYQDQQPPRQPATDGKAVASLIIGIVAVICAWNGYSATLSVIMGIAGIVLGSMSRKEAYTTGAPTQMASWGIGLSVASIVIACVALIACVSCLACVGCAGGMGAIYDGFGFPFYY